MGHSLSTLLKDPSFLASGAFLSLSPHSLLVGWGKRLWQKTSSCFYAPDFFLSSPMPWFTHEHMEVIPVEKGPFFSHLLSWESIDEALFTSRFHDTKEGICKGWLKKAVPFTYCKSLKPLPLQHVIQNLMHAKGHLYGMWEEGEGILGVTPELLFSIENKRLKTMAVAGTRGDHSSDEAFLFDPKEQHEHQIVIEGICTSLSPYGKAHIGKTGVLKAGALTHLWTPIEVELIKEEEGMIAALHPTPALGALPKKEGVKLLQKWQEERDRKRFGAPFGAIFQGKTLMYVAIRNVQFDCNGMEIHAGCGVVQGSTLEKEMAEIKRKIDATKGALGL